MNQIENAYGHRIKHTSSKTATSIKSHDDRSIKSLDFESDIGQTTNYDDYASEPVPTPKLRPAPPKKPLRLSLQRAKSLQAVCGMDTPTKNKGYNTPLMDTINISLSDRKRAIKRFYKRELSSGSDHSNKLSSKCVEKYV
jgi:peptidoglycan hydrolase-like amidase